MAKRTCDPTSGSIGKQTYGIGRNGQFVRYRAIPANPKTITQESQRAILTTQSKAWDALTDDQRKAWSTAASGYNSKARLGTSGPLTGNQYFCQINCALVTLGIDAFSNPPAYEAPGENTTGSLVITNTAGVIAITVGSPDAQPSNTEVWSSKPCRPGVQRTPELFLLGILPAPSAGAASLTNLLTSKWGVLRVGERIFVGIQTLSASGAKAPMVITTAVVPAV